MHVDHDESLGPLDIVVDVDIWKWVVGAVLNRDLFVHDRSRVIRLNKWIYDSIMHKHDCVWTETQKIFRSV